MGFVWSAPRPEVEVTCGRLRGKAGLTPTGTQYHAFLGVPYAKPPVGDLRFKAPEPAEPWTGVRDAVTEGNPCLQEGMPLGNSGGMSLKTVYGLLKNLPVLANRVMVSKKQSEDCLFLNVYTPVTAASGAAEGAEAPATPLRPVLFWIHGGAFKFGDGNADVLSPELFLERNILVVTINYRLGPFGFLSLGTADVPGNAGLKDQVLALRWTRDNIKAFGGDPDAITIYGESAGGASVHHLSLSPLAKGMFRGVIASSGSAVSHWACTTNALACARTLAKHAGVEGDTPEELAKGLRAISAAKLNEAVGKMPPLFETMTNEIMWLPVVEQNIPGAFLTEDPMTMLRDGKSSNVPLMTGVCSAEGLVWLLFADPHNEKTYSELNTRQNYILPPDLLKFLTPEQREKCAQDILNEYTGGKPFSKDTVVDFIELFGDVMFRNRTIPLVHLHAAAAAPDTSPVYLYRFDFVGRFSCLKWVAKTKLGKDLGPVKGAAHGDDLWYLSNIRIFPLPTLAPDSPEMVCRRRMVDMWANFAETGNPTPPGSDEKVLPVKWTPCSASSQPYLNIGKSLEMRTDQLHPRQAFWEELYRKYTGEPMSTFCLKR